MAVIFHMTYSKKLGLPNFSSHSCWVSLEVEIAVVSQVTGEAKRLYALMQDAVDREIQEVGYLPDATVYGMNNSGPTNGNGHHVNGNGNGHYANGAPNRGAQEGTPITDKQLDLIGKVVRENNLDKQDVEQMAVDMFGAGVRALNRMQASNLIDELFEQHGRKNGAVNASRSRYQPRERSRA